MPATGSPATSRTAPGIDASILADPDPHVAAAYAMFRRPASSDRAPSVAEHVEFLVDRQGYLRGSSTLADGRGRDSVPALRLQIKVLEQRKYRPAPRVHVH